MKPLTVQHKCFYCNQFFTTRSIVQCPLCNVAQYCHQNHQQLHWNIHQPDCENLRQQLEQEQQHHLHQQRLQQQYQQKQQQQEQQQKRQHQLQQQQQQQQQKQQQQQLQQNLQRKQHQKQQKQQKQNSHQPQKHQEQNQSTCQMNQIESNIHFVQEGAIMKVNQETSDKVEVTRDVTQKPYVPDGGTSTSNANCMKSCCTFPLYELPNGITKEEILKRHSKYLVKSLHLDGYCCIDGLLGDNKVDSILSEVCGLVKSGVLKAGELVKPVTDEHPHEHEHVRGDKTTWISGDEIYCRNIKCLMNVIDHLVGYCEGQLSHVIKGRTQAMVARYEGDGIGYKYHIDNASKDGRCISCLYYINKSWDSKQDGGTLRAYPLGRKDHVDIDPIADRLLVFWSDSRTPHEVLPPYKERFAITLWYFDAKEREEVRKRYFADLKKDFAAT